MLWMIAAGLAFAQEPAVDPTGPVVSPSVPAQAPPSSPGVRVVYTGNLGGVGSGTWPLEIVRTLRVVDARPDLRVAEIRAVHGVLAQGEVAVHAVDGRVATVLGALESGLSCGEPRPVAAVRTPTEVLTLDGDAAGVVQALVAAGAEPVDRVARACRGGEHRVEVLAPAGATLPPWELERFELRLGLVGSVEAGGGTHAFRVTALAVQEASRLHAAAQALLAERPDALYVDAGRFVDGASSVRDGGLSLHRPLTYGLLQARSPAALVPGESELVAGWLAFAAEQREHPLPYLASNLVLRDAPQGPPLADPCRSPRHLLPRCRVVTVQDGGVARRLAFVGVLDPALGPVLPDLAAQGVAIEDPVASIAGVVAGLQATAEPPDAVIALTTAGPVELARLRDQVRGVDLLVGDSSFATFRVEERSALLRPLSADQAGAPLTLPMDGLATLDLGFDDDGALRSAVVTPRLVQQDLPVDPEVTAAVTRLRAQVYPELDAPLLPPEDPDRPLQPWSSAGWSALVCEAVRGATDADSVLLRALPPPSEAPGGLTRLQALGRLEVLDRVEVHRVTGEELAELLDRSWGLVPIACGATADSPKAWGRKLDDDRVYRLVTTDRTRHATPLGALLADLDRPAPLDRARRDDPVGPEGAPLTLRSAAYGQLVAVAEAQGVDAVVPTLRVEQPKAVPPRWLLRIDELSLAVDRFAGVEDPAFDAVTETLATSPSSTTVAAAGALALERSGSDLTWDLQVETRYGRLVTEADDQETADDLKSSTSLEVSRLGLSTGPLTWDPYLEVLYDSELTPTVDSAGVENPLQSDLYWLGGLSAREAGPLESLHLGAFVSMDLAATGDAPSWGGRLDWQTEADLGRWLQWTSRLELLAWGNTLDDDEGDLRFRALGRTGVDAPLSRWLDLGVYAQGYALQGRVPENDALGFAWTLGVGLDAARIFRL